MKYLKTYESYKKPLYANGDIVLVKQFGDQLMRITFSFIAKENYYTAELYSDPEGFNYTIDENEIIKKLEPHEIEALKYNL